jgi:hypothetical protein
MRFFYALLLLINIHSDDIDLYRGNIIDSDLLNIISFQTNKKNVDTTVNMYSIGYYKDILGKKEILNMPLHIQLGGILSVHNVSTQTYEGDILIRFKLDEVIKDFAGFNLGLSFAEGLSYVSGDISYEDGTIEEPDKTYHFQNYLQFQVNVGYKTYKNINAFFRIHHRSGVYGIVAPPKVGSNFVGLGINYKL